MISDEKTSSFFLAVNIHSFLEVIYYDSREDSDVPPLAIKQTTCQRCKGRKISELTARRDSAGQILAIELSQIGAVDKRSFQRSAISDQLSAISYQLSAISFQLFAISR